MGNKRNEQSSNSEETSTKNDEECKRNQEKVILEIINCNEQIIQFHRNYQMRVNSHRQKLWEAQKHFTWWISAILSSILVVLLANEDLVSPKSKAALLITASVLGLFFSLFGFNVNQKESKQFDEAIQKIKFIEEICIGFNFENVDKKKNEKCKLKFKKMHCSIRKTFNAVYSIFSIIFLIIVVICIMVLNNNTPTWLSNIF